MTLDVNTAVEAVRAVTVCATEALVLGAVVRSPRYRAVKFCVPATGKLISNVATPELTGLEAKKTVPFQNPTKPVAVAGVTVAFNVVTCAS